MSLSSQNPLGVVLFNLGGPDSLAAVKPFLYNLFSDPDILQIPGGVIARKPLAWLISTLRAKKSRGYFEAMGGKSPLKELTLLQAAKLEEVLNQTIPSKVVVAMRYWKPTTQEAITNLQQAGVKEVVLLPLYPQYSYTSTRSSVNEWKKCCKKLKVSFEKEILIESYADHLGYVDSLVQRIEEGLLLFPEPSRQNVHLLFSAHGVPVREIKAGDPYEQQIHLSMAKTIERLSQKLPFHLAYQSRVGPLKWLEPNTIDMLKKLAKEGVKDILAIPISFVSDHSETLYELKKQYGALAKELGIEHYELMPALNDSPLFIGALKELILEQMKGK